MLPAIVGVAMLVPLSCQYCVPSPLGSNPCADHTETPGAVMSGLMRPSWVGPRLLKSAMSSRPRPLTVAPAVMTFFAVPKRFIDRRPPIPAFAAAKTTRKSWLFQMKLSVSAASWI